MYHLRPAIPTWRLLAVLLFVATGCTGKEAVPQTPNEAPAPAPGAPPASPVEEACDPGPPGTPSPTRLLYLGPTEGEYGDRLRLEAQLLEAGGHPLAGRELRFTLGTQEATALTDSQGVARTSIVPSGAPALLPLTVAYAGEAGHSPASFSTRVYIQRAETTTHFLGPVLLPTGAAQQVRAELIDADDRTPIAGRTLVFEVGGTRASATTDSTGVATASLTLDANATGTASLRVSFAGDTFYKPSAEEIQVTRYLPTGFAIWGGNTPGPRLWSRVNFWGHSWAQQVQGGDYSSQADFKGFAASLSRFALCQPTARTTGAPRLAPGCWSSKTGQSSPPPRLPQYIGVLVSDSIDKQQGEVYGNVAALAVVKVDSNPAYGPVPGKPGWGTLVAIIEGGSLFPPPASLTAAQRQPESVLPGQRFEVTVDITNTSRTPAEEVLVIERFSGSRPEADQQALGTLPGEAQRTAVFMQTAPAVGPRGVGETEEAYQARLARADGRRLTSTGAVCYVDPSGTKPLPIQLFSEGRLGLPRLTVSLSAPRCVGPCSRVAYSLTVGNAGSRRAASTTAHVTLSDGSLQVVDVGPVEPGARVVRTAEFTVPSPGPRGPEESVEDYLRRLQAFMEQSFAATAQVSWTDEAANDYGPLERRVAPQQPQVPVVFAALAEQPPAVLPGQVLPFALTVSNQGTARARETRVLFAGGTPEVPAFDLEAKQSRRLALEVPVPRVAPRGESEPSAAYQARLEGEDGRVLSYGYEVDWGTACGSRLGTLPGSVRTFQVLPVVTVTLEGPAEAPEGEPVTYALTLRNVGQAEARALVLTLQPPTGPTQEVVLPVGALAQGASVQVPFTYTLPVWDRSEPAVAVAFVRWEDVRGTAYGPLNAREETRVLRTNRPPLVHAGPDQTVTLPARAMLAGEIRDDGLPAGAELSSSWVQVSGPATVWFANASQASTEVTFPEPGTYVLRLVASDSQLTGRDELTVTVLPREGSGGTLPGGSPSQNESLYNLVRRGNQLQLNSEATGAGFLWVAVSGKGTVVKIDTETGLVVGEYWTSPDWQPKNPSRTTVDLNGSVWVGNRDGNSVVHIGLLENGQCQDRNGNGMIETSRGRGDIKPWTNLGGVDTNGGVATAHDECIIHYTRVNSSTIRHISVDRNNDVWVSGTWGRNFDLIDGRTGQIKRSERSVGYGGYGGLIDSNGVIWSARPLLRWDTALPLSGPSGVNWRGYGHDSYGLCVGADGSMWNTAHEWNRVFRFSAAGDLLGTYPHGDHYAQGCVVDRRGHVWIAHSLYRNTVGHLKPDGSYVGKLQVGSGPTGVALDKAGKIWVTNHNSRTVSRIDPLKGPMGPDGVTPVGEVDFTSVDLGGTVYNYSDMTGSTLSGAPLHGLWTVVHDSAVVGSEWGKVSWTGQVCGNGSLEVTVSSSANSIHYSPPVPARSGEDFDVPNGRYLKVVTAFRRSSKGESPTVYDMTLGTSRYVVPPQSNSAPEVSAGRDRTATFPNPLRLVGSACDDGLPGGSGLSIQWSKVSGPGSVTFSAPGEEVTQVTFSEPGTYVLRLTASDSVHERSSEVTVTATPGNFPPTVAVDSPHSVTLPPGRVLLTGSVTDDGLPAGGALSMSWSTVSGPGTVTFETPGQVPTYATFSRAGTYVVRLTATDGQLTRSKDVLVQVGGVAAPNRPPEVAAGPSLRLTLPERTTVLKGSATDDGQPAGRQLSFTWSQVSGPTGVTFANNRQVETGATFPAAGAYVLRLTVSDSQLAGSADVRVVLEVEPPQNQAPTVSAGEGQTVALPPGRTVLSGRALDDGQPEGEPLRLRWSEVSGPRQVVLATPEQAETAASFGVPGDYTLRLWASDSERSGSSTVRVGVRANLVNAPPVVSASGPTVVNLPALAELSGSVRDEGLPATGELTVAWSQVSGPGTVTFTRPDRVATRASFSEPGEYVLRLTASDSELSASVEVAVGVTAFNQPPTVSAGVDQVLEFPLRTVTLNGQVSDDGWPPGNNLSVEWSVVQGPSSVSFSRAREPISDATFNIPGIYVLRLTASDSELTSSSDVTVRVLPSVELETPGWIAYPLHLSTVKGSVPIRLIDQVTLQDGVLGYWPADDHKALTVLATGISGAGGSTLGTLDTSLLVNGPYVIWLSGTDSNGVRKDSGVLVTVSGEYKPGRVYLEITDLTVEMAGVPVEIERIYDSLKRRESGDFGHGWSLTMGSTDLKVSPTSDVTLTQLNGERVTFYFTPQPLGWLFPSLLVPEYTAEPGVYGKLTANGCSIVVVVLGKYVCMFGAGYTPESYVYNDPSGVAYTVGSNGYLRSIKDLNGSTLTLNRNGIVSSEGNLAVNFERDSQNRITSIIDPEGSRYQYSYDVADDLKEVKLPGMNTPQRYTYDAEHLLLTAKDARDNTIARMAYYPDGKLKSETNALGHATQYSYDSASRATTITDPGGGTSILTYDPTGMVLSTTDPLGRTTRYAYDSNRNRVSESNALGETSRYSYDSNGNVATTSDPLRNTTSFVHNRYGAVTQLTNAMGQTTTIEQNGQYLPTSLSDSIGVLGSYSWNDKGNPLARMDPDGRSTSFSYDAYGNTIAERDPLNNTTLYTYDLLGRRTGKTDALGRTTRYTYDTLGRLNSVIDPLGSTTTYEYDANGNEVAEIDPIGRRTTRAYDAANQLIAVAYPDGTSEHYTYDFRGNHLTETDRAGRVTRYSYDIAGQLISMTVASGTADEATTIYAYDDAGRKISERNVLGQTTNYVYDAGGRLIRQVDALGSVTSHAYDANGQRISTTDALGRVTSFSYDARGRPTATIFPDGTSIQRQYNGGGQMVARIDQANRITRYRYDDLGRLISIVNPLGQATNYSYDAVGNLLSIRDANGNVMQFAYDELNRMTMKTWPDGTQEVYEYDVVGNLIRHQAAGGESNRFYYDAMDPTFRRLRS
jgi:YD repeat-containing protein